MNQSNGNCKSHIHSRDPFQFWRLQATRSATPSGSEWIVTTTEGEEIVFKAGVTMGMPYINIREHTEGVAMLQTVETI